MLNKPNLAIGALAQLLNQVVLVELAIEALLSEQDHERPLTQILIREVQVQDTAALVGICCYPIKDVR